ncbi:ABC transporter substrate-binding protein [Candidatus Beckwithbacteria bacterium]|nr:ABC transporter substrate-binding protein [Candidatus Beckwithbacteria bacterium]
MKKFIFIIISLIVLFIGASGFILGKQYLKSKPQPTDLIPLSFRLKWTHQGQFAGFYIANQEGFYQQDGLDVTIKSIDLDRQITTDYLITGEDDIAIGSADEVLIARSEGQPVKAVAVIFKIAPLIYLTKSGSNINSPYDFVGKTIALSPGQGTYLYESMLGQIGIDRTKIKEIPMTDWDLYKCWETADICPDYATNGLARAENDGVATTAIWPNDYGVPFYADVIFTTDSYIQKHPDIVATFVKDSLEGWQEAIESPQKAVEATLQFNSELDKDFQLKAIEISIPLINTGDSKLGWMDPVVWQKMQDVLVKQGLMKKSVDINTVFTNEFIR